MADVSNNYFDDSVGSLSLFQGMEIALKERLRAQPNDEKLLYHLAGCMRQQGRLEEAIHYYRILSDNHENNFNYRFFS